MKNVLGVIGAGVLGQHIAHYAKLTGKFSEVYFFDDTVQNGLRNNYGEIIGNISDIENSIKLNIIQNLLIGIGYKHMEARSKYYYQFSPFIKFPNIIHESCYIDESVLIGNGNIVLPHCLIDKSSVIGNNIFFNPGCTIAHDNLIEDHSFFGPGVTTSGFVNIGSGCILGTGTIIIDNISIKEDSQTGAGAVITKSINESGVFVGVPGRNIK